MATRTTATHRPTAASGFESPEQEVQELVWAAIDGIADQGALARLQELVESEHKVREACLNAMEMDLVLRNFYGPAPQTA